MEISPEIKTQLQEEYKEYQDLLKSEPGAEKIIDVLGDIEELTRSQFNKVLDRILEEKDLTGKTGYDNRLKIREEIDQLEAEALGIATGIRKNLSNLIDDVSNKIDTLIQSRNIQALCEGLNILLIQSRKVILPPDDIPVLLGNGEGKWEKDKEGYNKLGELLGLLRDNEIYADDLVIISGMLYPDQMRQESYILVEIPRIERSILLCNVYGEASFVFRGCLSRNLAFQLTKQQLQEKFQNKVIKIIFQESCLDEWREQMRVALFTSGINDEEEEEKNEPEEKIDVRNREYFRKKILESFPTPEEFVGMKGKERCSFKINGFGLTYIANTVFKLRIIGDSTVNKYKRALFARAIYGEGYKVIDDTIAVGEEKEKTKSWSLDRWREEIKKQYPTPEEFMGMENKEIVSFKINGFGLAYIANTVFGLKIGSPVNDKCSRALLAEAIYGEGHKVIKDAITAEEEKIKREGETREKIKSWDPDRWREEIMKKCPTPEKFMGMENKEIRDFKINNSFGLMYIANTIFGLGIENPTGNKYYRALLARTIYGEGHKVIKDAITAGEKTESWDSDRWREEIKKKCPTPEEFMGMTSKEVTNFKINSFGLTYIANTVFGLGIGNTTNNKHNRALLANAIYGEKQA